MKQEIYCDALYIKGFGPDQSSTTFNYLANELYDYRLQMINYSNQDPVASKIELEEHINKQLKSNKNLLLIGNSLGGYWANYFSEKYKLKCILINPSLHPEIGLKKYGIAQEKLDAFDKSTFSFTHKVAFLGRFDEVVNNKENEMLLAGIQQITWINQTHRVVEPTEIVAAIKTILQQIARS